MYIIKRVQSLGEGGGGVLLWRVVRVGGGGCSGQEGRVRAGTEQRLTKGWHACSVIPPSPARIQSLLE
jgi:hypothetical protein